MNTYDAARRRHCEDRDWRFYEDPAFAIPHQRGDVSLVEGSWLGGRKTYLVGHVRHLVLVVGGYLFDQRGRGLAVFDSVLIRPGVERFLDAAFEDLCHVDRRDGEL